MVVISDGGDNHSRYTESELRSLLKEADVEVYAIGVFDPCVQYIRTCAIRIEEKTGPLRLDEVTSVTGGRVFSAHDSVELSRAVTQISHELRNQYILGYYPSDRSRDGKWRRLKVHLAGSASQASFRLYAKKGYYAPTPANQNPLAALKQRTELVHPLTSAPGLLSTSRSFISLLSPAKVACQLLCRSFRPSAAHETPTKRK